MSYVIRAFRADDLVELQRITVEAFDGVSIDRNIEDRFGQLGERDWRWRKARHVAEDVARHAAGVFVAEEEATGQVVGYISTWLDTEASLGNIPNLAVDARHRGQGLGRQLIEFALEYFRRSGLTHAKIETLDQNPIGQHLYPACGFVEVARQIHYCRKL